MTYFSLEFDVPLDYTLGRYKEILEALQLRYTYELGGEDGHILYNSNGKVCLEEIDLHDMPEIMKIIIGAGCWPYNIHIINPYTDSGTFPGSTEDIMEMFEWLDGDYAKLSEWIVRVALGAKE